MLAIIGGVEVGADPKVNEQQRETPEAQQSGGPLFEDFEDFLSAPRVTHAVSGVRDTLFFQLVKDLPDRDCPENFSEAQ